MSSGSGLYSITLRNKGFSEDVKLKMSQICDNLNDKLKAKMRDKRTGIGGHLVT